MAILYCPITRQKGTRESKFTVEIEGVELGLYARELDYSKPQDIELLNNNGLSVDETPRTVVVRLPFEGNTIDARIEERHLTDLNPDLEKEFDDVYMSVLKETTGYVGTMQNPKTYLPRAS